MIFNDHYQYLLQGYIPQRKYVLFSGPTSFTLGLKNYSKHSFLYYSTDNKKYSKFTSTVTAGYDPSDSKYKIYLQGKDGTEIGTQYSGVFNLTGENVSVSGDISAILNAKIASKGTGATQKLLELSYTFSYLFSNINGSLISAKDLRIIDTPKASFWTFQSLFENCSGLVDGPKVLYSPTTSNGFMGEKYFKNCTSLVNPPVLIFSIDRYLYQELFTGCSSLTRPPKIISQTKLHSTAGMYRMFHNCTSLNTILDLSYYTTDASSSSTFGMDKLYDGCTNIKVSETQDAEYQYPFTVPSGNFNFNEMFTGTGGTFTGTPVAGVTYYTTNPPVPWGNLIEFSSPNSFIIEATNGIKWDGTLEYSTNGYSWNTWDASSISSASNGIKHVLYFRGTGNTVITGNSYGNWGWRVTGSNVEVSGNTNVLFDYATVANGSEPSIGNAALAYWLSNQTAITDASCLIIPKIAGYFGRHMFSNCSNLKYPPIIASAATYGNCYENMFENCTSLIEAPALLCENLNSPTWSSACYQNMFTGCTSLNDYPYLPATTLTNVCYANMFKGCTSLETAPELPATSIANGAQYASMFEGCISLKTAPDLPATSLNGSCYKNMFKGCTSLTSAPKLPAETLQNECYRAMFQGCTSITTAPTLPALTLANNCYREMFQGCTALTTVPTLPATTGANEAYNSMFAECTSLVTAPKIEMINAKYANFSCTFSGCTNLEVIPDLSDVVYDGDYSGSTFLWYETFKNCSKVKVYTDSSKGEPLLTGYGENSGNTFYGTSGDYKGGAESGVTYYTSNQLI